MFKNKNVVIKLKINFSRIPENLRMFDSIIPRSALDEPMDEEQDWVVAPTMTLENMHSPGGYLSEDIGSEQGSAKAETYLGRSATFIDKLRRFYTVLTLYLYNYWYNYRPKSLPVKEFVPVRAHLLTFAWKASLYIKIPSFCS